MQLLRKNKQKGATAIEYALIVGGIGVAISGVVFLFGDKLAALYQSFGGLI